MAAINPKGRAYFSNLFSRTGGSTTPKPGREVQPEREVEVVEPISRVEVTIIETDDVGNVVVEPHKKSIKGDRSSRWSHSSPRRHHHAVGSSSQPLSETIFVASTRFSRFVHTNLDGPSHHMFQSANVSSLMDSAIKLAT